MSKRSLREAPALIGGLDWWICTGFASGWLRPAPGTWGSLAGLVLVLPLIFVLSGESATITLVLLSVAGTFIGTWSINRIEARTGIHDAGEIVIDEWVGQWIALIPVVLLGSPWQGLLIAFLLFRLFDIVKPWPIGWLDRRVSGGFGVMVDDIVAGLFVALGIPFIRWILHYV